MIRPPKTLDSFDELLVTRRVSRDGLITHVDAHSLNRRETLHNALGVLSKRVDIDRVSEILREAKHEQWIAHLEGFDTDWRRQLKQDQEKLRALISQYKKIRRKYPGWKRLCEAIERDGLLNVTPPALRPALNGKVMSGPLRRPKPGHQPEPWLNEARKKLAQVRVPKEMREELLAAIGLIRMPPA